MSDPDADQVVCAAGFSDWDVDSATSGLCGTFALALRRVFPDLAFILVCLSQEDGQPKLARDGEPFWKHVLATDGDRYFDIEGEVRLDDVIENYCWDNRHGKGGIAVPISADELERMLRGDSKSYDEDKFDIWTRQLASAKAALAHGANARPAPKP